MKKIILPLLMWLISIHVFSQNTIGLPDIINYSKQNYKAGAPSRQITQDKNGILYFANSEGVLTFNGIKWKIYPLPNKSVVRSVEFGPDNKLYVGGQDEFGYFSPAGNGELEYHSLRDLIDPAERSFTDVWGIYFYKDLAFFQTSNKIFQISGKHCTVYKSNHWRYLGLCNDRLIAQDIDKGLLVFQNGMWAPFLTKNELPSDYFVTGLAKIGEDSTIVTTVKSGVYLLKGAEMTRMHSTFLDQVAEMHFSSAIMVNEDHIALTTNLDGCYIINKKGELVQKFSRKEGLQNNNILAIFLDREKNIWLGLDNGIDFIAYNNAIKHIYPDYLNEGAGYAISIFHNQLYLGTSNGLYKTSLYDEKDLSYVKAVFEPVQHSQGQVWNLSQVNDQLLMGHNEGAFTINNNEARLIDKSTGFWGFLPFYSVLPSSLMVAGTYQGVNFYNYSNNNFTNANFAAKFESSRFLCIDNNNIWVSHPYKGLYKITINNNVPVTTFYDAKRGVQSANGIYIFKVKNRIILTTENGVFEYNDAKDLFEPSSFFNELFSGKVLRYLKEDNSGNIWFVFDKIIGVVDMSSGKPQLIYFPELTNRFVSGFEQIYPVNKNNIFIGGEKGFYHINYEQYKKIKYPLQVRITTVKTINNYDSLLYGGYAGEINETNASIKKTEVSHNWNSFHFEYASPGYAQQASIEYSYFLEGFDTKWSEFSKKSEKEYTNLPAGKYTFKVKVRNNLGNESDIAMYEFRVLKPWYQSTLAYFVYWLLFLVGAYILYRYLRGKFAAQQAHYQEEQKRLQYLHQLEMEKTDKEIVKLKNEKLEAEIKHKNTELASVAMHLVQKGELLTKLKDQIVRLKKHSEDEKDADDLKKIIKVINDEDKIDTQWEQFTMHFDNVHSDFLSALKSKYPMTINELKLSAYLRMNLSTKEIAQLMNISVRGVEISRYRLRKKLQIPTEVNLFDFLMTIETDKKE